MRKILAILAGILMVCGVVGGAQATLIEVGSFDKALTPYPISPLNALTSPYIDTADNLNILIDDYNTSHPNLPEIAGSYVEKEAPGDFPDGTTSGTIDLTPGFTYLSLKYGNIVDLWYVLGETEFEFGVLPKSLSHYREWNPSPLPEPATMLLVGIGLIGLAAVGRQRFFKK